MTITRFYLRQSHGVNSKEMVCYCTPWSRTNFDDRLKPKFEEEQMEFVSIGTILRFAEFWRAWARLLFSEKSVNSVFRKREIIES